MNIYATINSKKKKAVNLRGSDKGGGDNIKWRDIRGFGREKGGNGGKTEIMEVMYLYFN